MSSLEVPHPRADFAFAEASPVVGEVEGVRLLLHARRLRGGLSLVEAAARVGLNRDELSRLERGQTTQVRFATLAKLIAAYDCSLTELLEVDRAPASAPLYAGALAALADGALPATGPIRRTTRRSPDDYQQELPDAADESSRDAAARRTRAPVGTAR